MASADRRVIGGGLLGLAAAALLLALAGVPAEPVPAPAGRVSLAAATPAPGMPLATADLRRLQAACRDATEADATKLRELALGHPDPLVAGQAIAALGRLGKVAGDPALHWLLQDPRPRVRDELTLALGQSGDPTAARLVEPLLAAADPDARRVAILALVRLGAGSDLATRVPPEERAFARAALQARPPGQLLGSTSFIAPRR